MAQCKAQQPQLSVVKGAIRAGSRQAAQLCLQAEQVVQHPVLQEGLPHPGVWLMQQLPHTTPGQGFFLAPLAWCLAVAASATMLRQAFQVQHVAASNTYVSAVLLILPDTKTPSTPEVSQARLILDTAGDPQPVHLTKLLNSPRDLRSTTPYGQLPAEPATADHRRGWP